MATFDIVIIGGGPAGLFAGCYARRLNLSVLIIEKERFGGKITEATSVENFPGFPQPLSGPQVGAQLFAQASRWGIQTWKEEVEGLDLAAEEKVIHTSGEDFCGRTLILAAGAEYRRLGVDGENDCIGNGLSFCALCDGPSMQGKPAAVIGAGDGGLSQALYLLQFTDRITVIEKLARSNASPILLDRALADPRISWMFSTDIARVEKTGKDLLLHLNRSVENEPSVLCVGGAILSIGLVPNTAFLKGVLRLDPKEGWVMADREMRTSVPGVFAAGDIRADSPRQAFSAASDGAIAAISAFKWLKGGQHAD